MTTSGPFFETDTDRQVARVRAMEELPLVDVTGAVGANPPTGAQAGGEDLWILRFSFAAWVTEGGALQERGLEVERLVTREELRSYMNSVRPFTIVNIRARVDRSSPEPRALLERLVGEGDSAELESFLTEYKKPVTYQDGLLGTFTLNRRIDCYKTTLAWNNKAAELQLATGERDELPRLLLTAHALWGNQQAWEERITNYAAQELLENANDWATSADDWSEEDEPITTAQFQERMKVESVVVEADGSFVFFYEDGDLFFGHVIIVSGSLAEGPTRADIAG